MNIVVDDTIILELINETHATAIFEAVDSNRTYLREWLTFVDNMQNLNFAENFVKGTIKRNKEGKEFAFVIIIDSNIVGRIDVYNIDIQNQKGELGYWLIEKVQGKGIITKSCNALIDFCFQKLNLRRIEIKCGVENSKSNAIAQKLHFTKENIIPQGELLNGKLIDLNLYSLLKNEPFHKR